jgi:hypothetical protein
MFLLCLLFALRALRVICVLQVHSVSRSRIAFHITIPRAVKVHLGNRCWAWGNTKIIKGGWVKKTECVGGDRKTCGVDGRMIYGRMDARVRVRVCVFWFTVMVIRLLCSAAHTDYVTEHRVIYGRITVNNDLRGKPDEAEQISFMQLSQLFSELF